LRFPDTRASEPLLEAEAFPFSPPISGGTALARWLLFELKSINHRDRFLRRSSCAVLCRALRRVRRSTVSSSLLTVPLQVVLP
jgi:hypothetical protein